MAGMCDSIKITRRDFIKKTTSTMIVLSLGSYLTGCASDDDSDKTFAGADFAVISDPHVYDTTLGTEGEAWQQYLMSDRKLLAESEAILAAAVEQILAATPRVKFVIVSGDLTKDGEKQCHELFASYMDRLRDQGIKVLVIPGNHDINNPHAQAFSAADATAVASVTPEEFTSIYSAMGYDDAIARDDNSLSYIAEPVSGLWVFCLDSCQYGRNYENGYPETSGAFSAEILAWITENIEKAKKQHKTIIGTMHHGILEHFTGQSQLTGLGDEYVVDNWQMISETFATAGLSLIFTGHYHAQDAVERKFEDGSFIFDVETGSLVTYPNPVRFVSIDADDTVAISTAVVTEIDYDTGGETFPDYAQDYLVNGLTLQAPYYLVNGFGVAEETATEMAPYLVRGMVAHYRGDESPTADDLLAVQTYMADSDATIATVGSILGSLWSDLEPSDTSFSFSLEDGTVEG